MTYTRFEQTYGINPQSSKLSEQHLIPLLGKTIVSSRLWHSIIDLQARFGGMLILDGLYNIYDTDTCLKMTRLCLEFFGEFQGYILAIGQDWLGYLYCADFSRLIDGKPKIIVFDINTRDIMDTANSIEKFHTVLAIDEVESSFNLELYNQWKEHHKPIQKPGRCVGYRIPLALGGSDDIENMEEADTEVYWSITGHIGTA